MAVRVEVVGDRVVEVEGLDEVATQIGHKNHVVADANDIAADRQ